MSNWELEKLYGVYQEVRDKNKPYNPRIKKGEFIKLTFEHAKGVDIYDAQAMYDSGLNKLNKESCTFICGGGLINGEWDGEKWRSDPMSVFY